MSAATALVIAKVFFIPFLTVAIGMMSISLRGAIRNQYRAGVVSLGFILPGLGIALVALCVA